MKYYLTIALALFAFLAFSQEEGTFPGVGVVWASNEEGILVKGGINVRLHLFPSEYVCMGPEINIYPDSEKGEWFEASFNGHYLFRLMESVEIYPIGGINLKQLNEGEFGVRGNLGAGFHFSFGRWLPYAEYIQSIGFEDEGAFLFGAFYSIEKRKNKSE